MRFVKINSDEAIGLVELKLNGHTDKNTKMMNVNLVTG